VFSTNNGNLEKTAQSSQCEPSPYSLAFSNFDQSFKGLTAKDIDKFKAIRPNTSDLNLCMCLFNLLVDVTVDSYPNGLFRPSSQNNRVPY
jgi:hypothetical protein